MQQDVVWRKPNEKDVSCILYNRYSFIRPLQFFICIIAIAFCVFGLSSVFSIAANHTSIDIIEILVDFIIAYGLLILIKKLPILICKDTYSEDMLVTDAVIVKVEEWHGYANTINFGDFHKNHDNDSFFLIVTGRTLVNGEDIVSERQGYHSFDDSNIGQRVLAVKSQDMDGNIGIDFYKLL